MMKILEYSLKHIGKDLVIEEIIRETESGRSASFEAIQWLQEHGYIRVAQIGRQKIIRPILDNYTLQYKLYNDSLSIKSLPGLYKLAVMIFSDGLKSTSNVRAAILFDDSSKTSHDLSICLFGKDIDTVSIDTLRAKVAAVLDIEVSVQYEPFSQRSMLRGLVFYQDSYFDATSSAKESYNNFISKVYDAAKNKQISKDLYHESLKQAIEHLSICAFYIDFPSSEMNKTEALAEFNKKYSANSLEEIKKIGVKYGQQLFV